MLTLYLEALISVSRQTYIAIGALSFLVLNSSVLAHTYAIYITPMYKQKTLATTDLRKKV